MFLRAVNQNVPLPPLEPYVRCSCGSCRECRDNETWDWLFAKFEDKIIAARGVFSGHRRSGFCEWRGGRRLGPGC
jgi:hypothetical protein